MPHLNLQSGVPKVVASGALVGATNFSEFPLGVGLPAGITPFGSTTSIPDPLLVEIGFDGELVEQGAGGQHFAMTGRGGENWGYGLDSFFGQMDRGEMRVIIRSDYRGGFEDFSIGAAAGMEGATNALWRAWIGTQFLRGGVNDIESSGKATFAGFGNTMFGIAAGDLQEPFIAGLQFNVRVRRIANVGDPSRDDWEIRSWYGGVGAEPALPDDTATLVLQSGAGLQAIGWGQLPQAPFNPVLQKIRFLSFSDNPLVEPAPDPSDIAAVSPWVPSGNQLPIATGWEPTERQLIPGGPKPDIANPEIEFDVRSILGLNDGDTVLIWPDTSGQGNDANAQAGLDPSFVVDGWTLGLPAVRMQDSPGDENENFQFSGEPEFVGTEVTFFLVFRVPDLSEGAAILGSSNGATPPRIWDLSVDSDGTIFFNHQELPRLIESAPGTIVEDEMYIAVGRMSNTLGMILRVNGVEVGRNESATAKQNILSYPNARIGQSRDLRVGDTEYGKDRLIVWASGYSSAASDDEIGEMESFLAGVFQFNFGTEWVRS
jgi:hypothetical protein